MASPSRFSSFVLLAASLLPLSAAAQDARNQALLRRVQAEGQAFLSSSTIDGRFWLRACIVNPRCCRCCAPRSDAAGRAATARDCPYGPTGHQKS